MFPSCWASPNGTSLRANHFLTTGGCLEREDHRTGEQAIAPYIRRLRRDALLQAWAASTMRVRPSREEDRSAHLRRCVGGTENPRGQRLYANDPVQDLVGVDPDMLVIINASPYFWGKGDVRFGLVADIAKRIGCPVVSGYQVGGNDDLIFDGRSFAVNERGDCIAAARPFVEEELLFDTEGAGSVDYPHDTDRDSELYDTLVLGTRDYLAKTGYTKAVIAESGGIDSALVTSIAADAIGAENVTAIGMPSPFSSSGSVNDARNLCRNLGVDFRVVSIGPLYDVFGGSVNELIGWHGAEAFGADVTKRTCRRVSGPRSSWRIPIGIMPSCSRPKQVELAVGYCTLYGDMVGGLAVISDVYKTTFIVRPGT